MIKVNKTRSFIAVMLATVCLFGNTHAMQLTRPATRRRGIDPAERSAQKALGDLERALAYARLEILQKALTKLKTAIEEITWKGTFKSNLEDVQNFVIELLYSEKPVETIINNFLQKKVKTRRRSISEAIMKIKRLINNERNKRRLIKQINTIRTAMQPKPEKTPRQRPPTQPIRHATRPRPIRVVPPRPTRPIRPAIQPRPVRVAPTRPTRPGRPRLTGPTEPRRHIPIGLPAKDIKSIELAEKSFKEPIIEREQVDPHGQGFTNAILYVIQENPQSIYFYKGYDNIRVFYNTNTQKIVTIDFNLPSKGITNMYKPEQISQIPAGRMLLERIHQVIDGTFTPPTREAIGPEDKKTIRSLLKALETAKGITYRRPQEAKKFQKIPSQTYLKHGFLKYEIPVLKGTRDPQDSRPDHIYVSEGDPIISDIRVLYDAKTGKIKTIHFMITDEEKTFRYDYEQLSEDPVGKALLRRIAELYKRRPQ